MQKNCEAVIAHLKEEYVHFQVGRVSPSILDGVGIEVYGTKTPLSQLASITNQGGQLLIIQPWDPHILKEIEKALRLCDRNYNPAVEGTIIRLPFPPLTEEKRKEIVKSAKEKCEEAKIRIKKIREEQMQELKAKKTNKEISEDAFFSEQKNIQKMVDEYQATIERLRNEKEKEILTL